jgi:hypothetical protein
MNKEILEKMPKWVLLLKEWWEEVEKDNGDENAQNK